jgi:hypothetical protein
LAVLPPEPLWWVAARAVAAGVVRCLELTVGEGDGVCETRVRFLEEEEEEEEEGEE